MNKNQEEYAELLCRHSFAEKVFFTNSGVESIECGLKVIRSFHYHHNNIEKKLQNKNYSKIKGRMVIIIKN